MIKSFLSLVLAMVLALGIAGCSSNNQNITDIPPSAQQKAFLGDPSKEPQSMKDAVANGMKSAAIPPGAHISQ